MNLPLLNALKIVLDNTVCNEHNVKAVVEIKEDTVSIKCCCDQFHTECSDMVTELLEILEFKDWIVEGSRHK